MTVTEHDQTLNSQKIFYTSPLWESWGVSVILEKMTTGLRLDGTFTELWYTQNWLNSAVLNYICHMSSFNMTDGQADILTHWSLRDVDCTSVVYKLILRIDISSTSCEMVS